MKIVVTGGAGFIGSHIAEFYAKNSEVVVFDNLSRAALLKKAIKNVDYNWNYLKRFKNVKLVKGDIRNFKEIAKASANADIIVHAAAQTAVTVSVGDPASDFETNALGTFNVLEASRINDVKKVLYCSTNKVYGKNVNNISISEEKSRYAFEKKYQNGVSEDFSIDLCEHTPYGCSKLTGDIYAQDYGKLYGIKTGVFRMSCIYGTRQFGVEDQGWVAWFIIAALLNKPITIYGDGKQVRDILFVSDLVDLFDKFIDSNLREAVLNAGGGASHTISLLELIELLKQVTQKKIAVKFSGWRPSDQKVYISDISKAAKLLKWEPKIKPEHGIRSLINWVSKNKQLFN
ncbi:MAG: NAD-dependent epimerase/dehydratase family protein [Nanoarchaeota archaeon]